VSGILDMQALVESASRLSGVAYAGCAPYWCSADGRERLITTIRDQRLERVVVAGCSPRTHRRLFQETAAQAGLSPDLFGLVNIREGCAWPHRGEHEAATRRAQDQIAMEVAHMRVLTLRPPVQATIVPQVLVIGGGLAGMTAALELAQDSMPVTLIERAGTLGSADRTDNPQWAADLTVAAQSHPNITMHLNSRVTHVDGSVGAYQVEISQNAQSAQGTYQFAVRNTFGAIIVATGLPDQETRELSRLLRLPQDAQGFIPELRVRLRPGDYVERGIYVCGAVHHPCDAAETQFQAYSAASRALHHVRRGSVTAHGPLAQVDLEKCNGCADCFHVCPFAAVTMIERPDGLHPMPPQNAQARPLKGLSLAVIDPLLCTGCGNCVSVCPVGAMTLTGWADAQLEAQMRVALGTTLTPALQPSGPQSLVLIFACEWSGYAAAELAGAQQLIYPPTVRMIRLDCSGRLQPGLILKAFEMGAAGVLVLGCPPRLCHYERGNERAAAVCQQARALTGLLGLPPARFGLAWLAPDDGPACAELLTSFVKGVGTME
jgi:heterodisulfide reductase subunit A-like polyferredoxin/coenzyme F420-reducing hydrogenase delta subunit